MAWHLREGNETKDLVSIIIPVYNQEKYLERCLDSVKRQTYKNIEIVLIDDGSTDGSGKICDLYKISDERFKVYHMNNSGVAHARNYGLEMREGEYISFIDPDDFIADNYIEELLNGLHETGTKMATCRVSYVIQGKKIAKEQTHVARNKIEKKVIPVNEYDYTAEYAHYSVWGAIYHQDVIKDIRFHSDYYVGEDIVFFGQALKKAKVVTDINLSLYYYIQYAESLSNGKLFDEKKYTEILAWKYLCELYEESIPRESCVVGMCLRCYIKFLKLARGEMCIEDTLKKALLECMRKYKKYVIRCKNIKMAGKASYVLFCLMPDVNLTIYQLYKKVQCYLPWIRLKMQ